MDQKRGVLLAIFFVLLLVNQQYYSTKPADIPLSQKLGETFKLKLFF